LKSLPYLAIQSLKKICKETWGPGAAFPPRQGAEGPSSPRRGAGTAGSGRGRLCVTRGTLRTARPPKPPDKPWALGGFGRACGLVAGRAGLPGAQGCEMEHPLPLETFPSLSGTRELLPCTLALAPGKEKMEQQKEPGLLSSLASVCGQTKAKHAALPCPRRGCPARAAKTAGCR